MSIGTLVMSLFPYKTFSLHHSEAIFYVCGRKRVIHTCHNISNTFWADLPAFHVHITIVFVALTIMITRYIGFDYHDKSLTARLAVQYCRPGSVLTGHVYRA